MWPIVLACATSLLAAASPAQSVPAQEGITQIDPLALKPAADESASPSLGLRGEIWRQQFDLRRPSSTQPSFLNRAVFDFRREWPVGETWKLGLSNRLEYLRTAGADETRNALREVYASRAVDAGFADAGRINWRNGVASGFNPTDYLKRGAVIEQGSQSPAALRENRLGTVMLRGQGLSAHGSVQLALIPHLARGDAAATSNLAPAWDRTNATQAALLKLAPQFGERFTFDALVYTRAGDKPQFGSNLTWLAGDALVAYAELSGGKVAAASGPDEGAVPAAWHSALATGLTWTTSPGIVANLEFQYSGDALGRERWGAWRQTIGTAQERELGRTHSERSSAQSPLVQRAWFMRLAWDDAFGNRDLALAAFARVNAFDRSRVWQIDAIWHLDPRHSLRLLVGGFSGAANSEYGSTTLRRYGSLNWVMYP